jgi:hypothetical protein
VLAVVREGGFKGVVARALQHRRQVIGVPDVAGDAHAAPVGMAVDKADTDKEIDRLFRTRLGKGVEVDEAQRIRVDDWELSPEVQAEVSRRWPLLTTETLGELADLPEYRSQFLRLFGFGIDGVDYSQDVDPRVVT